MRKKGKKKRGEREVGREKKRKRGKKPNKHGIKSSLRKFGCRCEARRKGGCEPPPGTAAPPSPPRRPRPGPVRPRTAAPTATFQLGGLGGGARPEPTESHGGFASCPTPLSILLHPPPLCALCPHPPPVPAQSAETPRHRPCPSQRRAPDINSVSRPSPIPSNLFRI